MISGSNEPRRHFHSWQPRHSINKTEPVSMESVSNTAFSLLNSSQYLWRNPFTSLHSSDSSDDNWIALSQTSYPFTLPSSTSPYDRLCGRLVRSLYSRNRSPFTHTTWFPDGRRCLATTSSGELTVWNGRHFGLEDVKRLPDSFGSLTTTEWSLDGAVLAVGDWGGGVHLCGATLSPFALMKDMAGHSILDLSMAPTGQKLVGAASDTHPLIWDLKYQAKERSLSQLGYDIVTVHWHQEKGLIAAGSNSDRLGLWDPRSATPIQTIMAHNGMVSVVRFSSCGNYIATAGRDGTIRIWNLRTLTCAKQFRTKATESDSRISCLLWHPKYSPRLLYAGETGGNISCYDMSLVTESINNLSKLCAPPLLTQITSAHDQVVTGLSFHPSGSIFTSVGNDGRIRTWTYLTANTESSPIIDYSTFNAD